jgi:hypothetical protein
MWFQDERVAQLLEGVTRVYQHKGVAISLEPQTIEVPFASLAAGAFGPQVQARVDDDSDFVWLGQSAVTSIAAGATLATTFIPYLVDVQLTWDSRNICQHDRIAGESGRWIPIDVFAGSLENPFYFAWPILIPRTRAVLFRPFNQGTAARTIFLTLLGFRVEENQGRLAA